MSSLFEDEGKKTAAALKKEHEKETSELYAKIGRLTTEVEWLKKNVHDSPESQAMMKMEVCLDPLPSWYYNFIDQNSSAYFVVAQTP